MKQDIYDLTVEHILDNQEKAYRLAYSYVQDRERRWRWYRTRPVRRWKNAGE